MKRIAIITPCILPVPAIIGGAVESLISKIIEDNEKHGNYIIDLFAIDYDETCDYSFSYTNLIHLEQSIVTKITDRLLDKWYRTFYAESASRVLDTEVLKAFNERLSSISGGYDAVVVENMMSTACKIVDCCDGKYDFPVYFHMHNDVDMYRSPSYIKNLVIHGVQFIAVSEYIKNRILSFDRNAVVQVLYNGVDLSTYIKSVKKKGDKTTFLYAGRIIPGKGVKELVHGFIMVCSVLEQSAKNNVALKIVGFSGFDQGYEYEIRRLTSEYENIECLDQVNENQMPLIYNSADVVVMPTTDEEPFGLVALETMAKGIPLIVTDSGALPEVVGDGACIVSKDVDLAHNLSAAMLKLVSDDEYAREIANKGYERAHSCKVFDINNYYFNFNQIIEPQEITTEDVISVIVPVYNASGYLRRCVESIINQTYSNIEILLINDGSTDDSGEICDDLAASDNRIRVIHQKNSGNSGSRNTGLDNVTGRYVFFCDCDDYLKADAIEKMLIRLKRDNADIVACGIASVSEYDETENDKTEIITDSTPGRWSGHDSIIQMMRTNNICSVVWNKLYKAELFKEIRYPLGSFNEDEATTYKLLYRAGIVSYMPEALYCYYQRESSLMHDNLENRYRYYIDAVTDRIAFFKLKGDFILEQHSRISLLEWIKYSYRNIENDEKRKELLDEYKSSVNFDNAPSVMGVKKKLALLLWKYYRY